jgi:hypothetical protein
MITTLAVWVKGAAAAAILGVAPLVLTPPATAGPCAPHKELAKYLAENHFERRRGAGLTRDGKLFEIFISEKGTWTVLVSLPTGVSCIVLDGTDWEGRSLAVGPEV